MDAVTYNRAGFRHWEKQGISQITQKHTFVQFCFSISNFHQMTSAKEIMFSLALVCLLLA